MFSDQKAYQIQWVTMVRTVLMVAEEVVELATIVAPKNISVEIATSLAS